MKKLIFSLVLLVSVNTVLAEDPVYFPDENLEAAVREELGISEPTPIYPSDMLGLTYLNGWSRGIVDLTGLEYATNLTGLRLVVNQISDLSSLSGLTSLTNLRLSHNNITDISALSGLTSLTNLRLSHNNITDISALSGLSRLFDVDLRDNNISTIPDLSGLYRLRQLLLNNNVINDISGLSGQTSVRHIWLENNNISDISALSGLSSLEWLYLRNNNISSIPPLSGLTSLIFATLSENVISDISGLSESYFPSLNRLYLYKNNINTIPPLSGLPSLTGLYLYSNNISDISGFSESELPSLAGLNLNSNNISDISALASLSHLYNLTLQDNNISDISVLSGLTNLLYLDLYYNNVSDISALTGLSNLITLRLDFNFRISDISALANMTNLERLYLKHNPLNCPAYNIYIPMIETKNPGIFIDYDPMPPECENEPPVADAGEDDRVAIGDTVWLDGSDSYDPEGNPLTYLWSFVSIPLGSGAMIDGPTAVQTFFMPDLVGDYVVSLVVNNGTVDSDPDTVTITAIPPDQAAAETLVEMEEIIQLIPPENLHNDNAATPLTKKIEATLTNIANGSYQDALTKLQDDILKKTDGCALTGAPDSTDWLLKCEDQAEVYPLVMRAIELLESLIQ